MGTERVTMPIFGLTCGGGGAQAIEHSLTRAPGVERAYVNPLIEMAYVEFDPSITSPQRLVEIVRSVGFRTGQPAAR